MTEHLRGATSAATTARSRRPAWPAYAAATWAFLFAATSFYWAAGGTLGAATIGPALAGLALARDPELVAVLWATGALKAVGGLVALALVQPWGRYLPRWLPLAAAWAGGALAILYGVATMAQHGLMVAGVIATPEGLGEAAARWHLLFWDPWWLLGGILFLVAAGTSWRRPG